MACTATWGRARERYKTIGHRSPARRKQRSHRKEALAHQYTHHDPTTEGLVHAPAVLSPGGRRGRSGVGSSDFVPQRAMSVAPPRPPPSLLSAGVVAHLAELAGEPTMFTAATLQPSDAPKKLPVFVFSSSTRGAQIAAHNGGYIASSKYLQRGVGGTH